MIKKKPIKKEKKNDNNIYMSDYFNIVNNNIKNFKNTFNEGQSESIENL